MIYGIILGSFWALRGLYGALQFSQVAQQGARARGLGGGRRGARALLGTFGSRIVFGRFGAPRDS